MGTVGRIEGSVGTKLEEFHAKYYKSLLDRAEYLCRTAGWIDPEDLVQHALLKLIEHGELEGEVQTRSWLIKVMNNRFCDLVRAEMSRQKAKADPTVGHYAHSSDDVPYTFEHVSKDVFDKAIEKLPAKQRDTFLLHCQKLPNHEIARKLGIKPGAVAQRLSNARLALRKLLQPYAGQDIH